MRAVDCAGAILMRGGRVLLGLRSAHISRYPGLWDILGGRLEADETFEKAMYREVEEEAGVVPLAYRHIGRFPLSPVGVLELFLVTDWRGGEPRAVGSEHTRLCWFAPAEAALLPDLIAPELRAVLSALALARL